MMQQQLYQQEQQPGGQDAAGHQMVLCPVRVVYETQMLVQQGEQIQPNQTIFINPQNPPPWIQNRAVQNQVIYVQHVPTNYVQPTQQHIDPSQLYIQNYGYQNVPQMLVQNPQEQIRPMQMPPANLISNTQTGIGQNVQTQRLLPNITAIPNTLNIVNAPQSQNSPINRQIAHSQITNVNEIVNNVKQENVSQNIYRQVPQTITQDPRNQMQQTVTFVPNNIQRPTSVYEQNIGQMQPIPQQNIANIQTSYQNALINTQDTRKVSAPVNKNISYNVVHPNMSVKGPQTFKPIQPRTNQIRSNAPQFLPVQPTTSLVQTPAPNMVNKNVPRKMMPNSVQVPNSIAITNTGKIEGNVIFNRKRKSESPDEMHRKISISNNAENPIIIKKIENVSNPVNCSDVGVNTSPIHKPDGRITINTMQITPLNPSSTQNKKIKEELAKKPVLPIKEPQNVIRNNFVATPILNSVSTEKDKLIRNTVFTQARGRVLNDKQTVPEINRPEVSAIAAILNSPVASVSTEVSQQPQVNIKEEGAKQVVKIEESSNVNIPTTSIVQNISTIAQNSPSIAQNSPSIAQNNANIAQNNLSKIQNSPNIAQNSQTPSPNSLSKTQNSPSIAQNSPSVAQSSPSKTQNKQSIAQNSLSIAQNSPSKAQNSPSKAQNSPSITQSIVESKPTTTEDVNVKNDEEKISTKKATDDIKLKDDRDFILTHVLDGYVIQESNIAFPIRKPLKEKALPNNSDETETRDHKDVKIEKDTGVKNNSKILNISHLHIKDIETIKNDKVNDKENPFRTLQPINVKSWTAEQLETHLTKCGWTETVTVLQEHEIDGESLLLVSKGQLLTIGVKEEHADIISEFVKS